MFASSMYRRSMLFPLIALILFVVAFVTLGLDASADTATPMMTGPNAGSADSFQGPHDWYFLAGKGNFDIQIVSMGDGRDTVPLDSAFTYKIICTPRLGAHAYSYRENGDGFTFHGTVPRLTRIVVRIIPATSRLVRVARNYTIEASGAAVGFAVAGADPIVGTYMDMSHGHGAVHFNKNGTIVSADGTQGTWTAFDEGLRIYTVTVGSDRASVKFVPGRGLLDQAGNGNSLYDSAH